MTAQVGTVIDGKYELLKQIGKGGMSVVYLAMDKRLNKQWAVKIIARQGIGKNNEVVINTVPDDAELMKKLDHPAIPRIVDIIDNPENPEIYIVMDYVEGESLDKVLNEFGAQSQETVIEWAKQICDTLGYLHSQKPPIIYRDMKPANIMLKPEGNLKIIDFGISREYKEQNLADTTVLGTRGYAPPEQYGSRQTDARSDIYALGMTMHHLVTGIDPRPQNYEYFPIRQWNPELSGGLERLIDKCTAIDPEDRYQNCNELMYALEHYEEEDENYKKKQKNKLFTFIITATLSLVMLLVGFGANALSVYENNQDYDTKINIVASTPFDEKVTKYLEAIDLKPTDMRAYHKLLEAYEDEGLFGDKQSGEFSAKYNANKANFNKTENREEYLDLLYETGIIYFYLYSEPTSNDNSFRVRVLKAKAYFDEIVNPSDGNDYSDYEFYDVARSHYIIGDFFSKFVMNATSVKEPKKEDYENLLASLHVCINSIDEYDYDDGAYIKLTMYKEIQNLLYDRRDALAKNDIDEQKIVDILNLLQTKTIALSVTQSASVKIRDKILNSHEDYLDRVHTTYSNIKERS
ncbi:MAG: serine/threonine protein kinase [Ruminococcaceae bacterium]|nr:serine/threonine protein kinase [Oscillospiraceae bacterium]